MNHAAPELSKVAFFTMMVFILGLTDNTNGMDGKIRKDIRSGAEVDIVLKADQRTEKLTRGIVADILTSSPTHPHGIKVRLTDGKIGRVKNIIKA